MSEETVFITNVRTAPVVLIVEPWGEHVPLAAGETVRLVARGQEIDIEVVYEGELIAAYVSQETTVEVFRGSELVCDLNLAFSAPLPAGWTVRDFVDGVFGGPGKAGET